MKYQLILLVTKNPTRSIFPSVTILYHIVVVQISQNGFLPQSLAVETPVQLVTDGTTFFTINLLQLLIHEP